MIPRSKCSEEQGQAGTGNEADWTRAHTKGFVRQQRWEKISWGRARPPRRLLALGAQTNSSRSRASLKALIEVWALKH